MTSPAPTIRHLHSHADYEACVALQRATWGDAFGETVPAAILKISQKVGGIAAGAFARDRMIGFVYGVTGWRDGRPVHWSHMLAVEERSRDHGLGRRLKAFQRAELVAAGVEIMYWTFDPLVARNAHLNLNRLGARVSEYVRDMYGDDPDSSMDRVIGTDRFVVEWALREPADEPAVDPGAGDEVFRGRLPEIVPGAPDLPAVPSVLVGIPHDIHAVKRDAPDAARAWRASTRRAFEHYLHRGYRVARIVRDRDGSWYVLARGAR